MIIGIVQMDIKWEDIYRIIYRGSTGKECRVIIISGDVINRFYYGYR